MNIEKKALAAVVDSTGLVTDSAVQSLLVEALPVGEYQGRRILLIIPDSTRTAPIGLLFKSILDRIGSAVAKLDILVALGTHPAMSEEAICERLEISLTERRSRYGKVGFFNHEWDNPAALHTLGTLPAADIEKLSDGRFSMDVAVTVNRRVLDYDELVILGPVFPHEVVGFSGGNKYLFPGVSGPEILNFFHWLGAVITNVGIIGNKWTPVRRVVDRAGAMVPVRKRCFAMVVKGPGMVGLFFGTPESAWDHAADLSAANHIEWKDRPFHTILSCAPPMYDELWVGGKCMYKLEPVLAAGGELIIYAPHLREISVTHGAVIRQIGYHCCEYFSKQWDRFKDLPWGVLAHSAHVFGAGTYDNGIEYPRARVTLATGIPERVCREINLGFRDWRSIRPEDYAGREAEGVLLVPKAGETLFKLAAALG
ncbi:MAG: DUF2088 domain-containing protein [Pedosphaera sp.]|nr:DUF2088 domain-containing protein [Pedosphaera sp.]